MQDSEILKKLCGEYDVQKDDLLSTKRDARLVDIRRAIALDLRVDGWSYSRIGRLLNRHHTSIMHLVGVI